jgi:macrolide-specific efflux system membrane fusion protein
MRLKLLAIVALLAVAGAAVAASLGAFNTTASAATNLLTAAATVTDVTDEVAATGTVASVDTWELGFGSATESGASGASVTWPVTEVIVEVGDRVAEGDVLATADTADLEARIADANRAAKSAALQLKQADADLDDASTTAQKRQAQIGVYNAQTNQAQADTTLAELIAQRGSETLTAPAAGIVTAVAISAGSDAPSAAAITIASAELEVSTGVVESDVANISIGQAATVTVAALDATLNGTVVAIDPVVDGAGSGSGVVSFPVRVRLDAPPTGLRAGMSADVTIVTASANDVVAVPSRALSGASGSYTVRVVADDGTVTVRSVEVGLVTSSLAEIKSGIQAGERVVTGTSSTQNAINTVPGGGAFPGGGVIRSAP